jgi:16S rRNA (adenine(1408)-N(1))-methyltransferase
VLKTAASRPDTLVVGLDANAGGMAEASRRAARKATRGGLPNALFIVAAAESLPCELDGAFDEVPVQFPWGSLLRGLVRPSPEFLEGLARVLKPGGSLRILVSITERETQAGVEPLTEADIRRLDKPYERHGLLLCDPRPADAELIRASHSTWAKRLGRDREVWSLTFRRA